VALVNSSARLTQTNDTQWTLSNTGVVNTTNSTITWTVTATEGAAVVGHVVVKGVMDVKNSGEAGATIASGRQLFGQQEALRPRR